MEKVRGPTILLTVLKDEKSNFSQSFMLIKLFIEMFQPPFNEL